MLKENEFILFLTTLVGSLTFFVIASLELIYIFDL